jgi:predicted HTH transcriptional regulator
MNFTALHRLLGRDPGPLTDEMIKEAVAQGIAETDYPKDIAAMANSGGGMIVYGVTEKDKKATGREAVDELTERFAQALRSAAVTAISPPVFGLDIGQLGDASNRCIAVIVPASVDGPHLIFRGEHFGAPIRNDADTVWMKERQIEAAYRQRFEERRNSTEAIDRLYDELTAIAQVEARAWLIAVARPRVIPTMKRIEKDEARTLFQKASERA